MQTTLDALQAFAIAHGWTPRLAGTRLDVTAYLRAYGRYFQSQAAANDNGPAICGRVGAEGPGDAGHRGRSRENGPCFVPVRDLAFPGRAA